MTARVDFLLVSAIAIFAPTLANAAELLIEKSWEHGTWMVRLYRLPDTRRQFCAIEAHNAGVVFSVNKYLDDGSSFVEVYSPNWKMQEGDINFMLQYDLNSGATVVSTFSGRSWSNSLTADFPKDPTKDMKYAFALSYIADVKRLAVLNSDYGVIARFAGAGSKEALASYEKCPS
jgi:hypothetical protein